MNPPPLNHHNNNRPRRRPDLTLPLPRRDPSLAVPLPLPPPSSAASTTPTFLNFSDLQRRNRVGSGAGGTVYQVLHGPTNQIFALKVIYGNHDDTVRNQIRREVQILRDVDNPNVVKCFECFEHNGEIQVLLEFMDGGSLEGKYIQSEVQLADVAKQILSGLVYLHHKKIVHRDIKPSNLLVNNQGRVKIADFGVGRILSQTMDPCNSSVGTIAYMSPERINTDLNEGKYDGIAGDIWSFGVSMLEFYLGRFPFNGSHGDWASLMCAICLNPLPELPRKASREFRNFIRCCLQRDALKRWSASMLLNHPFIVNNTGSSSRGVNGGSNGVVNGGQIRKNHEVYAPSFRQMLPPPLPYST